MPDDGASPVARPSTAPDAGSPHKALQILNVLRGGHSPVTGDTVPSSSGRKWPRPERLHQLARAVVRARKLGGGTRKFSDHNISIPRRAATSVGIHGSSVFKDFECPNPSSSPTVANVMSKCGKRPSAAMLGRACAKVDGEGHALLRAIWQEPATSLGGPALFDTRMGGNKIYMQREGVPIGVYRQHANASQNPDWYGKRGYRGISAEEPFKRNMKMNRETSNSGPWLLMPGRPSYARRKQELVKSEKFLQTTMPRIASTASWKFYNPESLFGDFRRFESYNLHFGHGDEVGAQTMTSEIGIVEFNNLWGKLKTDIIGKELNKLARTVENYWEQKRERLRLEDEVRQKELDKEQKVIEKLQKRAEHEKREADEAVSRMEKEKIDFEKAVQTVEDEKMHLDKLVRDSEKDGVVDDAEARMIERWKFEVKIAEARLEKERKELEDWKVRTDKETEEAHLAWERCQREVDHFRRLREEQEAAQTDDDRMLPNMAAVERSVLCRIEAACRHLEDPVPEMRHGSSPSREQEGPAGRGGRRELARVVGGDASGYEGEWEGGRPSGRGVETLRKRGLQYLGQFEGDVYDGHGALLLRKLNASYVGCWARGLRQGPGVHCHTLPDGATVPVVFCVCDEGEVVHFERFRGTKKAHAAVMDAVKEEIDQALKAARQAEKVTELLEPYKPGRVVSIPSPGEIAAEDSEDDKDT